MLTLSPFFLIDPQVLHMADGPEKYMTGVAILVLIPFFICSFGLFAFARYAFFRLELDNPDSHGKEFHRRAAVYYQMELDGKDDIELRQSN